MNMDWKDSLGALRGTLPEGEDNPVRQDETVAAKMPVLEIVMERKGRGGKTATIVDGFTCDDDELAAIAAKLKSKLGTGGSARGGEILIQGDRRADVAALLKSLGYTRIKGNLR